MIDIELQRARSAMAESVTLPIATWLEALDELGALRQAIPQPVQQEPVAKVTVEPVWDNRRGEPDPCKTYNDIEFLTPRGKLLPAGTKLYAAPVRTKDLTDDELDIFVSEKTMDMRMTLREFARAVIAADRETK